LAKAESNLILVHEIATSLRSFQEVAVAQNGFVVERQGGSELGGVEWSGVNGREHGQQPQGQLGL
jgi:hypothetical protein